MNPPEHRPTPATQRRIDPKYAPILVPASSNWYQMEPSSFHPN